MIQINFGQSKIYGGKHSVFRLLNSMQLNFTVECNREDEGDINYE